MITALQLSSLIGQLTPENAAMLEAYAEFLLLRQNEHTPAKESKTGDSSKVNRLKIASRFKGKAKFPKTATQKMEVYDQ